MTLTRGIATLILYSTQVKLRLCSGRVSITDLNATQLPRNNHRFAQDRDQPDEPLVCMGMHMSSAHHGPRPPEHKEAVRLSWRSRHIPVGTILLGTLLAAGVASAVAMVAAYGPVNPVP